MDLQRLIIGVAHAVSAAVNGDKDGKFKEFLELFEPREKRSSNLNDDLDAAKAAGLPIEEA